VTVLLDANVLIALVVTDHVHHTAAETWLTSTNDSIATCPITQGSLVRLLIREGQSANTAHTVLTALSDNDRHEFWPDDITYRDVPLTGVIGHRQVTDAYRVSPNSTATSPTWCPAARSPAHDDNQPNNATAA
jgi:toxin-antitoxin system PIN domain toxin